MITGRALIFWKSRLLNLILMLVCVVFTGACQSTQVNFLQTEAVQLAPPKVEVDSLLFNKSAQIKIHSGSDGDIIKYTLDGSEVTSNALDYSNPFMVTTTTNLKVKTFNPDFKSSDEVGSSIIKMAKDISNASVNVQPDAHESYSATGPGILVDGRKGQFSFRNGNRWLGFQQKEITIDLSFKNEVTIEKVLVGLLQDHGSWIFFPKSIQVKTSNKTIGQFMLNQPETEQMKKMSFIEIPVDKSTYDQVTITIHPLDEIPEWHPGKGTLPWTFVDEILIE